jgi:hypothetical protein
MNASICLRRPVTIALQVFIWFECMIEINGQGLQAEQTSVWVCVDVCVCARCAGAYGPMYTNSFIPRWFTTVIRKPIVQLTSVIWRPRRTVGDVTDPSSVPSARDVPCVERVVADDHRAMSGAENCSAIWRREVATSVNCNRSSRQDVKACHSAERINSLRQLLTKRR